MIANPAHRPPRPSVGPHARGLARPPARRPACRRGGFTLIEILVVIGVILVLVAIAAVGYNALDNSASTRQTKVTLAAAQGLLAEYEMKSAQKGLPAGTVDAAANGTPNRNDVNAGVDTDNDGTHNRYDTDVPVIGATVNAMSVLLRVPANKAALGRLTEKALLPPQNATTTMTPPRLADAWTHPVIFVPAGGLAGVTFEVDPALRKTVTSAGVIADGAATPATARPFFASAGPDGDFTKADDNVYSFEN